jgi:hypothetical protein
MQKIVITGGTGFVGRAVCERLAAQDAACRLVTVPTRRLAHGKRAVLPTVDLVQADVHDPQALARLLAGADAVVNLVAILHGSDDAFDRVHVAAAAQPGRGLRARPACGGWCMSAHWAWGCRRHRRTCAARPPAKACAGSGAGPHHPAARRSSSVPTTASQPVRPPAAAGAGAAAGRRVRASSRCGWATWPQAVVRLLHRPARGQDRSNAPARRCSRCRNWCSWPGAGRLPNAAGGPLPESWPACCRPPPWPGCPASR